MMTGSTPQVREEAMDLLHSSAVQCYAVTGTTFGVIVATAYCEDHVMKSRIHPSDHQVLVHEMKPRLSTYLPVASVMIPLLGQIKSTGR